MEQPAVNEVFKKAEKKYAKRDSQKNCEHTQVMMVQACKEQYGPQWNIDSEFTPVIGARLGHIQDKTQRNIK